MSEHTWLFIASLLSSLATLGTAVFVLLSKMRLQRDELVRLRDRAHRLEVELSHLTPRTEKALERVERTGSTAKQQREIAQLEEAYAQMRNELDRLMRRSRELREASRERSEST